MNGEVAVNKVLLMSLAILVGAGLLLSGCEADPETTTTTTTANLEDIEGISVTPTSTTATIGGSAQFTATATYSDATTADISSSVTWTSDDTNVATIDSSGLATGVAEGTVFITASLENSTNFFSSQAILQVTADTLIGQTYSIGGTVSGLTGSGLVLQNNLSDNLSISADGAFTFATEYENGQTYDVTVLTQATEQTCTVANGSGTISGADVTTVEVTCAANPALTIAGTTPANGDFVPDLSSIVIEFSRAPGSSADGLSSYSLGGAGVGTLFIASVSTSSTTTTVSLQGISDEGEVTLTVSGIIAEDGTALTGLANFSFFVDKTAPDFGEVTPSTEDTQGLFDEITIVYTELMAGADDLANYALSGAAAAGLTLDSVTEADGEYTLAFSGVLADGSLNVFVSATDLAGNGLEDGNITYTVDVNNPTVTADPAGGSTLNALTTATLTFSEDVTGADSATNYDVTGDGAGTLAVTNASGSGDTYTLTFSGSPSDGDGTIEISNVVNGDDLPLEGNTITYEFDVTAPTVTPSPAEGTTLGSNPNFVLSYDESMQDGAELGNYDLGGDGAGTLFVRDISQSTNDYTFTEVGYPAAGTLTLTIGDSVTDLAGNTLADNSLTFTGLDAVTLLNYWPCTCQSGNGILDMAYGNVGSSTPTFVAVGRDGGMQVTNDGTSAIWQPVDLGSGSTDFNRVIYDGSQFIAAATPGNLIAVSANGSDWEWRAIPAGNLSAVGIAYDGSSTHVLVTASKILYTTNLDKWEEAAIPSGLTSSSIRGLTYGNGTFMAVTDADVITSSNGQTWSAIAAHGISNPIGLAYGEPGSTPTFMVAGNDGSVATSTDDGDNWASATAVGASISRLTHDGANFLAFGSNSFSVRHSPDAASSWDTAAGNRVTAIAGNGTNNWAAAFVGGSPPFRIMGSNNLSTFSLVTSRLGEGVLNAITFDNDDISIAGTSEGESFISTSGGTMWTAGGNIVDSGDEINVQGIAYGEPGAQATWVAVGLDSDSNGTINTSTNGGTSWTNQVNNAQILHDVVYDATIGSGTWVAVGVQSIQYSTSSDATAWSSTFVSGAYFNGVASDGSVYVAVGDDGEGAAVLYTSSDGQSWSAVDVTGILPLEDVIHDGNIFIAVGRDGTVLTSGDGTTWSEQDSGVDIDFTAVAAQSAGNLLGVGSGGGMAISSDSGETWSILNSGSRSGLTGVIYDSEDLVYVIVGGKGTVLSHAP